MFLLTRFGVLGALVAHFVCVGTSSVNAQCEQSKLTASDAACGDYFGVSVAIEGEVAVVSAEGDDHVGTDAGSAYVFRKIGSNWVQEQKLIASDAGAGDRFGSGVAISQGRILVGAFYARYPGGFWAGSAYIFRLDGTIWVEEQKLLASDVLPGQRFGWSVALHGNVAAVASISDSVSGDQSGAVYVFRRSGTTWVQEQKVIPADIAPYDYFGTSVSVYNDRVVVGSRLDDPRGSAYVFRWNGVSWVEEQKLTPSDNTRYFGVAVAMYGDRIMVGADDNADPAFGTGGAFVYRWNGVTWAEEAKLTASDGDPGDAFGRSVAIRGDRALVGAFGHPRTGDVTGAAYLFQRESTHWVIVKKLTASDVESYDNFAIDVSLAGDAALIGALGADDANPNDPFCSSGSAYIYDIKLCLTGIPALSPWGIITMLLGLVGAGMVVIKRRSRSRESGCLSGAGSGHVLDERSHPMRRSLQIFLVGNVIHLCFAGATSAQQLRPRTPPPQGGDDLETAVRESLAGQIQGRLEGTRRPGRGFLGCRAGARTGARRAGAL
jgi:hypothetical protein